MPDDKTLYLLLMVLAVVPAVLLHEIAHGVVACFFGDTTAKDNGRLNLNPLRHVDVFGTIVFPLLLFLSNAPFLFGWAKPVPVNFGALKNPKKDMVWVALAGPATNFVLGLLALGVLAVMAHADAFSKPAVFFLSQTAVFNFSVMIFNLLPVLPMDGGRILTGLLPLPAAVRFAGTEKYGLPVMVVLLIGLPLLGDEIGVDLDIVGRYLAFAVKGMLSFFVALFGIV